jgi:hypothetical protein
MFVRQTNERIATKGKRSLGTNQKIYDESARRGAFAKIALQATAVQRWGRQAVWGKSIGTAFLVTKLAGQSSVSLPKPDARLLLKILISRQQRIEYKQICYLSLKEYVLQVFTIIFPIFVEISLGNVAVFG